MAGSFKHGLTSAEVAARHPRLAELYAMYLEDGGIREHIDTIAFFAARIDELIEGSRGSEFYKGIEEAFDEFKRANRAKDQGKMRAALDMLERLITQGGKEAKRWSEIYELHEKLGKAREKQDKREVAQKMVVPLVEFYMARTQLLGIIRKNIDRYVLDADVRKTLLIGMQKDFDRLAEMQEEPRPS